MEIYSSALHGTQGISAPHRLATPNPIAPAANPPQMDSVMFSAAAKASLETINSGESSSSGVRFDLVNRIKREIAVGTYDTPDKMDIAMDRLIGRLNPR